MKKFSEIYAPFFTAKKESNSMNAVERIYGNGWELREAEEEEARRKKQETLINPDSGKPMPTQAEAFKRYEELRKQFGTED